MQYLTLGGGCFWCVEAAFIRLDGVIEAQSGYANGSWPEPTYEQVCSGRTGHAEVVRVGYDSERIGLEQLLDVFFAVHDPSTLNRQGHDSGTQYRSAIYTDSEADLARVRDHVAKLAPDAHWEGQTVVTEIEMLQRFWPAEAMHDRYFDRNPYQGYCRVVIAPKVEKLHHSFHDWLKPEARA